MGRSSKAFQPTLPVRGATSTGTHRQCSALISTHAPRAGSDRRAGRCFRSPRHFNPRSPCGERHYERVRDGDIDPFQPTLPVRGATCLCSPLPAATDFNPRSPCGERPSLWSGACSPGNFNPRSPCGERQTLGDIAVMTFDDFNPRSPCGERLVEILDGVSQLVFQPTLPVRGAT